MENQFDLQTAEQYFYPSEHIKFGPDTTNQPPVPEDPKPSVEWLTEYFQKTGKIAKDNQVLAVEKSVIVDSELNAGGNIHPFKIIYENECEAPKEVVVKTAYGGK